MIRPYPPRLCACIDEHRNDFMSSLEGRNYCFEEVGSIDLVTRSHDQSVHFQPARIEGQRSMKRNQIEHFFLFPLLPTSLTVFKQRAKSTSDP